MKRQGVHQNWMPRCGRLDQVQLHTWGWEPLPHRHPTLRSTGMSWFVGQTGTLLGGDIVLEPLEVKRSTQSEERGDLCSLAQPQEPGGRAGSRTQESCFCEGLCTEQGWASCQLSHWGSRGSKIRKESALSCCTSSLASYRGPSGRCAGDAYLYISLLSRKEDVITVQLDVNGSPSSAWEEITINYNCWLTKRHHTIQNNTILLITWHAYFLSPDFFGCTLSLPFKFVNNFVSERKKDKLVFVVTWLNKISFFMVIVEEIFSFTNLYW